MDFAGRFAGRADELLRHSGYRVLAPRSVPEAAESFDIHREEIAFIAAAVDHEKLASAMQSVEPSIRVFLFGGADQRRIDAQESGRGRRSWSSLLGTFP
jgi:hypothetical protein